ncbi:MAG: TGS domain-containing protein, partial [Bacteroidales bacterium]|nr:TGS domain-containing protein [Bacteroidales bacterium]
MINITFPDGNIRQYEKGVTPMEIAMNISEGLARNVLSAKVNGEVMDATISIDQDATVQLLTWNDDEGKATMWHSSAHLMAETIEYLYPGAKFGIGPDIEHGFYYDIDLGDKVISENDFQKIENKMLEFAREKQQYIRKEISKSDALKYFKEKGDEYKLELIDELEDGEITFYE